MFVSAIASGVTIDFSGSSSREFNDNFVAAVDGNPFFAVANITGLKVQDRQVEYGKQFFTFIEIIPNTNASPLVHQALKFSASLMRKNKWECDVFNIPDLNAPKKEPRKSKRLKHDGTDERDLPREPSFNPERPMHILSLARKGLIR